MIYYLGLYFNYDAFKDCLILVANNSVSPNRVVKKDDVVGLYFNDELIGINIFNSFSYFKLRLKGLLVSYNSQLDNLISSLVKEKLNEDIHLADSSYYLGKIVSKNGDLYTVKLSTETALASSLESISSTEVVLLKKEAFFETGERVSDFIDESASYLIIGEEVSQFDD